MNYFAYPSMFAWFMAPLALVVLGVLHHRHRKASIARLGQPATIVRMLPPNLRRRRAWIQACRVMGLACFVAALAGPLIGAKLVEFKQKGIDVFIAIDCSLSMQAEDLKPNRMAHAKLVLGQLIERLAGSRIGIIVFAGQAHVMCPLTVDDQAAKDILQAVEVNTVPVPGSVIGDAIRTAIKGLHAGEGGGRVLVLLSDGEDHHSKPLDAAKDAAKAGLKVFPVGIGTPEGEPIPVFDESGKRSGYKRDKRGEVVLSKLNEGDLIQIAQATGGQYLRASVTGDEVEQLANFLSELQQGDQKTRLFNRYENRFQWPLGAGVFFLLVSLAIPERRWKV
jgi:Ca-activated chloride channel homolog